MMVRGYQVQRSRRRVQMLVATAITTGVVSIMNAAPALAGPEACINFTQDSSVRLGCYGNQSAGLKGGTDFDVNKVDSIFFGNLKGDINAGSDGIGAVDFRFGKDNKRAVAGVLLGYTVDGSPAGKDVSVKSAGPGIVVSSTGRDGPTRNMGVYTKFDIFGENGGIAVTSEVQKGGNGSGDGVRGKDGPSGDYTHVRVIRDDPSEVVRVHGGHGRAITVGNSAGRGGDGSYGVFYAGGTGGKGGSGDDAYLQMGANASFMSPWNTSAIYVYSKGASGGRGGDGANPGGGRGGFGGSGGDVGIVSFYPDYVPSVDLTVGNDKGATGSGQPGVFLYSQAGNGGNGGSSKGSSGGTGNGGGFGGAIDFSPMNWTLNTYLARSPGIVAQSIGGAGGKGGSGGWFESGGKGGESGDGGAISLETRGSIRTRGADSGGIIAQSLAGHGGMGGSNAGVVSFSASGGSAGQGGEVKIVNGATVVTASDNSTAILAQSVGGGGGNGGDSFGAFYSQSGNGSNGGHGSAVTVDNTAKLTTSGADSFGILAQSIGGVGGNGGIGSSAILALGGRGKNGSHGGTVSVTNSGAISTGAKGADPVGKSTNGICGTGCSSGILAQSIGGGGGNGGVAGGMIATVGGGAGGGGNGGAVNLINTANVTTMQVDSHALVAQSIGGGGGNAGGAISLSPGASIAVGGTGGSGGSGGAVNVKAAGGSKLVTQADNAHGLLAQSTGGGGGRGGYAVSVAVNKVSAAFAVGGKGGNGGHGGAVEVDTRKGSSAAGEIQTAGKRSAGISAVSNGGGGGDGGFAVSAAAGVEIGALSFALGGSGGKGGNGGAVSVMNDARVTTTGNEAPSIRAYSVGGGGGTGGFSVAGNINMGLGGISAAVGGAGSSAGRGSSVYVRNYSSLTAHGDKSPLIDARSIGGGGGNGGFAVAGTLSTNEKSGTIGVSIGGSGGEGNDGGSVEVVNSGGLNVTGSGSSAIVAQSVGGGGGDGGMSFAAAASNKNSVNISLAIGGAGGASGSGGDVKVKNDKQITAGMYIDPSSSAPRSVDSYGIFAQSIGGSGGNGGLTGALSTQVNASANEKPLNISVAVGGKGGSTGKGGIVTVDNSGGITTLSDASHAIFGQSIGGSGGTGSSAYAVSLQFLSAKESEVINAAIAVGGKGGNGSTGGEVKLSNSAALRTRSALSHGLFGQSIGGSGGEGGSARTVSYTVSGEFEVQDPKKMQSSGARKLQVSVGGNGGTGAHGGLVTLYSSGSISTEADGSIGIFGQSIGGGGGNGGNAADAGDIKDIGKYTDRVKSDKTVKIILGGSGNASGNGGKVQIEHTQGDIITRGLGSAAIVAQSVGGGGGTAGTGTTSLKSFLPLNKEQKEYVKETDVKIGGVDSANGDGGEVIVNFRGGNIVTHGSGVAADAEDPLSGIDNSYGIFAQSVGGGGGVAGNASFFGLPPVPVSGSSKDETITIGIGIGINSDPRGFGMGGNVTVNSHGNVTTKGANAIGIFAQSVGGGGGVAGDVGITHSNVAYTLIGTAGGVGIGGDVRVQQKGDVSTSGPGAHGIFAQSAGTKRTGSVFVSVEGDVKVAGADAHAIFAQSTSMTSDNKGITVEIAKGSHVLGGFKGVTNSGSAIRLDGNANVNHVIRNAGTIEAGAGKSGYAVQVSGRAATLYNNGGTIVGSIDLAGGTTINDGATSSLDMEAEAEMQLLGASAHGISGHGTSAHGEEISGLLNGVGSLIEAGPTLRIGDGATLTNSGTIKISRLNAGDAPVALTGNFTQTEEGVLAVELDAARAGDGAQLTVSGKAEIHGEIDVNLANQTLGAGAIHILDAKGGIDPNSTARLKNALSGPVARFALLHRFGGKLSLNYDIDFARADVLAQLGANHGAVAGALKQIYTGRTIDGDFLPLLQAVNIHDYSRLLERLTPVPYAVTQTLVARSSDRFNDSLLDCRMAGSGGVSMVGDGGCVRVGMQARGLQHNVSGHGYDVTTGQFSVSGEKAFGDSWVAGFGVSYERWTAEADRAIWSSKADQFQAGASLKRYFGDTFVAASISGGYADVETKRNTQTFLQARGDQDVWFAGGQLRVGHLFSFGNWYVRPQTDLNVAYVNARGVHEQYGLRTNLIIQDSHETFVSLQPAVEFGGWFDAGNGLRIGPHFSVGLTQYLTDPSGVVSSAFLAAPGVSFKTSSEIDRTSFDFKAGVDLVSKDTLSLGLNGFTRVGKDNVEYGGGVKLGVRF